MRPPWGAGGFVGWQMMGDDFEKLIGHSCISHGLLLVRTSVRTWGKVGANSTPVFFSASNGKHWRTLYGRRLKSGTLPPLISNREIRKRTYLPESQLTQKMPNDASFFDGANYPSPKRHLYRPAWTPLMRKPFIISATFTWLVYSAALVCSAATQPFIMKQATYEHDHCAFRCEAELDANDEATLTLIVPPKEKDFVLNSIHTSHPARITQTASTNGNVVFTIRLTSTAKATVGVTYLIKPNAETHRFRYGIELTTSQLDGYTQIFDCSGSNASWEDTRLVIHHGQLGMGFRVTMQAGESVIVPIPCLTDYPVTLAREEYYRLFENQVYEVHSLINPGTTLLPKGNVRVLNGGILQFVTQLEADLAAAAKVDLRIASVAPSVVEAVVGSQEKRWYKVVNLDAGILHFQTRSVQPLTLKNKTQKLITIHAGNGKIAKIPSSETISLAFPVGNLDPTTSANLFDLTSAKIDEHVSNLDKGIVAFPTEAIESKIGDALVQLKTIQDELEAIAKLQAAKQIIEDRLKDLLGTEAPAPILQSLTQQLSKIAEQINQHKKKQEQATIDLTEVLFN